MTKDLILLRGLPGAGKSTLAQLIAPNAHFTADDYFTVDGVYKFDGGKSPEAHDDCQARAEAAMAGGVSPICIHNTLVEDWEVARYQAAAEKHGYRLHTLIVEGRQGLDSLHNVPPQVVGWMRDHFSVDLGK